MRGSRLFDDTESLSVIGHPPVTDTVSNPTRASSESGRRVIAVVRYIDVTVPSDDRVAGMSPAPRKVRAPWTRCQVTPGHAAGRDG